VPDVLGYLQLAVDQVQRQVDDLVGELLLLAQSALVPQGVRGFALQPVLVARSAVQRHQVGELGLGRAAQTQQLGQVDVGRAALAVDEVRDLRLLPTQQFGGGPVGEVGCPQQRSHRVTEFAAAHR
jgi:hypothetical protein